MKKYRVNVVGTKYVTAETEDTAIELAEITNLTRQMIHNIVKGK